MDKRANGILLHVLPMSPVSLEGVVGGTKKKENKLVKKGIHVLMKHMRARNISFHGEIKKISIFFCASSRAMTYGLM